MPRTKKKRAPMTPEEAQQATDEFMLTQGRHMSIWYDAWYEQRGSAIIEAKENARRISDAKVHVIRSRPLDTPPEALVGSAPTSRASVPSQAHFTSPGQRKDGDLIRQMRICRKLAANHAHAKARLKRAPAKK